MLFDRAQSHQRATDCSKHHVCVIRMILYNIIQAGNHLEIDLDFHGFLTQSLHNVALHLNKPHRPRFVATKCPKSPLPTNTKSTTG
ncbi:hypothetical protein GDO78_011520 [Eleutherodactylus coqui]|uniref:Uncharacterized protein n=1 Tax=Eleutherodactylus coqui TaxID=57060 RepID=A0A8J6F368_ELECQ|nr:hypothetical protein GDO78_011520 [Eleutherodactylus coqui]